MVFTGDLFWNHCLPNLIDADTRAQIHSNAVLLADYPDANFVPGHGAIGKAADVRAFRGYLLALRQAIAAARDKGASGTALQREVLGRLQGGYGTWNYFEHFARTNIAQTATELAGKKPLPEPLP